ncbi:hypothetical protein BDK51DRAFT_30213 [Blyttiomyces helicus]|uniref:Uncharacterized protein n=1 Tax=Blyttiomyces helicus TaxID=388810 RepID=A0A4P9WER2_9FUNG|nr:hypothetical protein BDK51DRAFT_30213 [Blyttiomyces helicus]|eukprot:RKO90285.1 hypothetical protein BDK51DRAFT_30213 [Blyttiomyces helicus]
MATSTTPPPAPTPHLPQQGSPVNYLFVFAPQNVQSAARNLFLIENEIGEAAQFIVDSEEGPAISYSQVENLIQLLNESTLRSPPPPPTTFPPPLYNEALRSNQTDFRSNQNVKKAFKLIDNKHLLEKTFLVVPNSKKIEQKVKKVEPKADKTTTDEEDEPSNTDERPKEDHFDSWGRDLAQDVGRMLKVFDRSRTIGSKRTDRQTLSGIAVLFANPRQLSLTNNLVRFSFWLEG